MFKTWTADDEDPEALARTVEGHLNEHADLIISVSYSVSAGRHHVLAVYKPVTAIEDEHLEAAVSVAEEIVEPRARKARCPFGVSVGLTDQPLRGSPLVNRRDLSGSKRDASLRRHRSPEPCSDWDIQALTASTRR